MRALGYIFGFAILAGAEFLCYWVMRQQGFSPGVSVGATMGLCFTLFILLGMMLLSRDNSPYGRVSEEHFEANAPHRYNSTIVARRPGAAPSSGENPTVLGNGAVVENHTSPSPTPSGEFQMPVSAAQPRSSYAASQLRSEAFRDELCRALQEKRDQFFKLLNDSVAELSRFDYSVLKTLERNSPGSVEGVVTARKIHTALEHRLREIDHFLNTQPVIDPEKGKQLLLGDLEVLEDRQLTAIFKAPAVPPIKISEVEFQLRVLLKRISRRRSIFRSTDMMDAQMAAEAIAAAEGRGKGQVPEQLPPAAPQEGEEVVEEEAAEASASDEPLPQA